MHRGLMQAESYRAEDGHRIPIQPVWKITYCSCRHGLLIYEKMDCAHYRNYFYVGGRYVDNGKGGQIMEDQMYVERLTPAQGTSRTFPVIFIHGGGQTGTVSVIPSNSPDIPINHVSVVSVARGMSDVELWSSHCFATRNLGSC